MKYNITRQLLPIYTKRRSGKIIKKVIFIVCHDTGNEGSTAEDNVNYYTDSANYESASAQLFVDDKEIIECIPVFQKYPEKAFHVLYQKPKDNELYGDDANDVAIGVEYCFGNNINSDEAYKRYIWVLAYLCYYFGLDPNTSLVSHSILDPERKTDPENGLGVSGRTYEQLLKDVVNEYKECTSMLKVNVFGKDIQLEKIIVQDNLNYVNLREVFEQLNCKIDWDGEKVIVTLK
jgi:N-acetylmuramoyl-L-alanine amidase CwlA